MIDQKNILGIQLNGVGDALAVLRAEHQDTEDEEVERPLQECDAVRFFTIQHIVGLDANPYDGATSIRLGRFSKKVWMTPDGEGGPEDTFAPAEGRSTETRNHYEYPLCILIVTIRR